MTRGFSKFFVRTFVLITFLDFTTPVMGASSVHEMTGSIMVSPNTSGFSPIGGYFLLNGTIFIRNDNISLKFHYYNITCSGTHSDTLATGSIEIPITCSDGRNGSVFQTVDTCGKNDIFSGGSIQIGPRISGDFSFSLDRNKCPVTVNN